MRGTLTLGTLAATLLAPLGAAAEPAPIDLRANVLANRTAYIPPQCYTRTEDQAGAVHNPCYTCHVAARAPNYINDHDLQTEYSLPAPALKNPWTNLFRDRTAEIAAIGDAEILEYVRTSNYRAPDGTNLLARRLAALPPEWDADGNGAWDGVVPDIAFSFDESGFDIGPDGNPTGWRTFAYAPVNGTFWPANGSTDDVLIRLPEPFRNGADGQPDPAIYNLNLSILEAVISRRDVPVPPVMEAPLGVDLDGDGTMGQALHIAYDWAPREGRLMSWVGAARAEQQAGALKPPTAGLYPLGTEFAHSVRYLDPDDATGLVRLSARMKELRYMRKTRWLGFADLQEGALKEVKERAINPDAIDLFDGSAETGISNGAGWRLQGFIEDAGGNLRPQSFEETVFCIGCHGGVGATDDSTFAFPRKLGANAPAAGWTHWTQKLGNAGLRDPIRADGNPEYALYLRENGAGDELRGNTDIMARFFLPDGRLRPEAVAPLLQDATPLLQPGRDRALALNKAYRVIVAAQSFVLGRDATAVPQTNVWAEVEQNRPTGVETPVKAWFTP